MQVNVLEAKTQLSKLLEAAQRGDDVVIANRGQPIVRLVRIDAPKKRNWGAWKGLIAPAETDAAFSKAADAEAAAEFTRSVERDDPLLEPAPPSTPRKATRKARR